MATDAILPFRLAVRPEWRRGQAGKGGAAAIGQCRARQSHESQRAARAAAAGGRWSRRARGGHFLRGAWRLPADPPRGLGLWHPLPPPLGACALCDVRARAGPSPRVRGTWGAAPAKWQRGVHVVCEGSAPRPAPAVCIGSHGVSDVGKYLRNPRVPPLTEHHHSNEHHPSVTSSVL